MDPTPDHKSDNADLTLPTRAAPTDEEVAPEKVISIRSMPASDMRMQVPLSWMIARTLSL